MRCDTLHIVCSIQKCRVIPCSLFCNICGWWVDSGAKFRLFCNGRARRVCFAALTVEIASPKFMPACVQGYANRRPQMICSCRARSCAIISRLWVNNGTTCCELGDTGGDLFATLYTSCEQARLLATINASMHPNRRPGVCELTHIVPRYVQHVHKRNC